MNVNVVKNRCFFTFKLLPLEGQPHHVQTRQLGDHEGPVPFRGDRRDAPGFLPLSRAQKSAPGRCHLPHWNCARRWWAPTGRRQQDRFLCAGNVIRVLIWFILLIWLILLIFFKYPRVKIKIPVNATFNFFQWVF